ncbi:ABC transporter permease subunit [Nonomuraea phyllanthi]|uniref:ABC transporter permease n=1 Tax=Nonomuraea phyllanthi TaxID=2219224 RepID=UPI0012937F69|nr:ABC transporter permease [Nonomuraea phyllanthi]QFY11999.1 ABC transporter permease subunit [Nonomuraea phyllanthi]
MTAPLTVTGAAARRRRRPGPALWLAGSWLVLLALLALGAGVLPLAAPDAPVGGPNLPPFTAYPEVLGTDGIGRSVLSRLVHGARISLAVSLGATSLAAVAGGLLGVLAAYLRGVAESAIGVLLDAILAFPPLLLLLALAAVVRPGVWTLVASLGLLFVPPFARLAKAAALSRLNREYVDAARALGAGHGRLLFRELLPGCVAPVASYAVVMAALMIMMEGALSFLGVGIPPPAPSWGAMIAAGKDFLAIAPQLVLVPCAAMFLTVLSFNTVGERLRARVDTISGGAP